MNFSIKRCTTLSTRNVTTCLASRCALLGCHCHTSWLLLHSFQLHSSPTQTLCTRTHPQTSLVVALVAPTALECAQLILAPVLSITLYQTCIYAPLNIYLLFISSYYRYYYKCIGMFYRFVYPSHNLLLKGH